MFVSQATSFTQNDSEVIAQEELIKNNRTVKELLEIFDSLDTDGSGIIEFDEFIQWTENYRVRAFFERVLAIDIFKAEATFKLLDTDGTGTLEREEFVVGCLRLKGGTTGFDAETQMRSIKTMKRNLAKIYREIHKLNQRLFMEFQPFEARTD